MVAAIPLALAAAVPCAIASDPPEKAAYVEMLRADRARDTGDMVAAFESYQRALELFQRLRAEQPGYKVAAIEFRMDYCREQAAAARSTPRPAEPTQAPREDETSRLNARIVELEDALSNGEAERRRMAGEIARLHRELAGADEQAKGLRSDIASLQSQLDAARSHASEGMEQRTQDAAALQSMRQELARQQTQQNAMLRDLDRESKRAESLAAMLDAAKSETELLRKNADVKQATAPLAEEIRHLNQSMERLSAERDTATARAAAAESALRTAQDSLNAERSNSTRLPENQGIDTALQRETEALRRDNDVLQKKLQALAARSESLDRSHAGELAKAASTREELQSLVDHLTSNVKTLERQNRDLAAAAPAPMIAPPAPPPLAQPVPMPGPPATAEATSVAAPPAPEPPAIASTAAETDWQVRANEAMEAKSHERALAIYEQVLRSTPDDVAALLGYARAKVALGDMNNARRAASRLTALAPEDAAGQHVLGIIEAKTGNRKTATKHFLRACEIDPANAMYHRDLAVAYYAGRQIQEAVEHYREVIRLTPSDGQAHFNLAALLLMGRNPSVEEVRSLYQKALSLGELRDPAIEAKIGL